MVSVIPCVYRTKSNNFCSVWLLIFLSLMSPVVVMHAQSVSDLQNMPALWSQIVPDSCSSGTLSMSPRKIANALNGRRVAFLGDSILRNIFCELVRLFEPNIGIPSSGCRVGSLKYLHRVTTKFEKKRKAQSL